MKNTHRISLTLPLLMGMLAGCAGQAGIGPQTLGQSVRNAQALQAVHPQGEHADGRTPLMDGVSAAHGVDRYQQSFARPQPPMNVLNILTGPGGGNMNLLSQPR